MYENYYFVFIVDNGDENAIVDFLSSISGVRVMRGSRGVGCLRITANKELLPRIRENNSIECVAYDGPVIR